MPKAALPDLDALCAQMDAADHEPAKHVGDWKPYSATLKEVRFHAKERYWHFTPTYTAEFEERLRVWLGNPGLSRSQRGALLRLVPEIQFVDRDDLLSLYRSAFRGPISRWLADAHGIQFGATASQVRKKLEAAIRETWFCPITDSMDIGQFLHINNVPGADHRPPWRVLRSFGAKQKIQEYCRQMKYRRLVVLEDFVGSGTQAAGPLEYAAQQLGRSTQILFVPLIASEAGLDHLAKKTRGFSNVQIAPVFVVPRQAQVMEVPPSGDGPDEDLLWRQLRKLVKSTFARVRKAAPPESAPLDEAFGFGSLGLLLVLYTNCPNNTLPLVWHSNNQWQALFPRVSRR